MLKCSADKELGTEYIDVKFAGLEVTTASDGLNLFSAAHFMLHYYCCQKGRAHTEIEQIGSKLKGKSCKADPE